MFAELANKKSVFTPSLKEAVTEYNITLKNRDNFKFNISDYVQKTFKKDTKISDIGTSRVADDPVNYVGSPSIDSTFVSDPRLVKIGDDYFIALKDFKFNNNGVDIVAFNNDYIPIKKDTVPETYSEMISNLDNNFKLVASKVYKDSKHSYIDVTFKSITEKKSLLVRVFMSGGRLTSFEVVE
ncbi:hypothetical protein D3C71_1466430 [compost metagenome]